MSAGSNSAAAAAEAIGSGEECCVMVVDDSRTSRLVLRLMLEHLGCRVREFSSAEAALADFEMRLPAAIITDMTMPGMPGIDFTRAIHARLGNAAPPVIAVTGRASEAMERAFLEAGGAVYLLKPVTAGKLAGAIAAVSAARQAAA